MRITEALKPVTDMLAAVGMSLDTATYKDGKLHVTLNTEAPKVTGKPGSGPECPPEGYRLLGKGERCPLVMSCATWWPSHGWQIDHWSTLAYVGGGQGAVVAVPIAPKPEPVKLSDQEKIVGWRGPSGFRLQTLQDRECICVVCKKTIKAGGRLARWRHRFPEGMDTDHLCGKPGSEENHSHAHVDCLYKSRNHSRSGIQAAFLGLDFHLSDVPRWLFTKREKYDAQQSTP